MFSHRKRPASARTRVTPTLTSCCFTAYVTAVQTITLFHPRLKHADNMQLHFSVQAKVPTYSMSINSSMKSVLIHFFYE